MTERKMKDSGIPWIGMIPEDWEVHCLRGISKGFKKGNGITKEDLITEGDTLCVRYGDLYTKYNQHIYDIKCRTNLSKITSPIYTGYGDILFACSGEDISLIGKSVAFMSYADCLVGGDLIIMKHEQNPRFLGYSLDSEMAQQQKSCGRSKLKVVHISVKDLKKIAIPIPPLSEQETIALWLDEKCGEIDELVEVEQKMIETLEVYRQATITETVTRGIFTHDNDIEKIKIKVIFEFRNGYTPSKANPEFWTNGTIPWFRMEDIRKNGRFLSDAIQHITPEAVKGQGLFSKNSFILATTATIGEHALLIADSLANQRFTNLKVRKSLAHRFDIGFLFYYFYVIDDWCKTSVNTTCFSQVNMYELGQQKIPCFHIDEQRAIADYLDTKCKEIDELIAVKREKIDTLKQYRQSIIFEAVTGKIHIN